MPVSKPWNQFPRTGNLQGQEIQCLDYMLTQINQLMGQANPPPSTGLATFGPNIINPTSAQITSAGGRVSSIATGIQVVATTTTLTFYWDGSNGSVPFQIYRDDNSVFGPFITDSGFVVTGLTPNTNYFVYPYFDELLQRIKFATVAGVAVGSPAVVFTAQTIVAAQQQILRSRLPLALNLSSTGVSTTAAGSATHSGGTGGGGVGIGGTGKYLP